MKTYRSGRQHITDDCFPTTGTAGRKHNGFSVVGGFNLDTASRLVSLVPAPLPPVINRGLAGGPESVDVYLRADYSGGIWNVNLSANYQVAKHIGVGIGYQFFQIDGTLTEDRWQGDLRVRFSGPTFQVSGFW